LAELTIPYLESLSTGELLGLAVKNGLDIPPGLERGFIIEELFYLDHDADGAYAHAHHDINQDEEKIEFKEFAALPKQYHISFIEVLIRDPLWAFVFWEVKAHDRKHYESAADFSGYCLRVIPIADEAASFIVSVDIDDYARYLGFPPDSGRCFKVELCMQGYEHCTVLAESRPFTMPRIIEPAANELIQSVYRNPLAVLSGVERFSLVRSEDRHIRQRDIIV